MTWASVEQVQIDDDQVRGVQDDVQRPRSWARRMAEAWAADTTVNRAPDEYEAGLEAAGELKAVRLKILLGQCFVIINEAVANGSVPTIPDGLMDEIQEELKR